MREKNKTGLSRGSNRLWHSRNVPLPAEDKKLRLLPNVQYTHMDIFLPAADIALQLVPSFHEALVGH